MWKNGLLLKLISVIPCVKLVNLIGSMLTNRRIRVFVNDKSIRIRTLSNALPQGSILAPLLFNLYISNMPPTKSRKFGYADDNALVFQSQSKSSIEAALTEYLAILNKYFADWRLLLNPSKTVTYYFHLCNRQANDTLTVIFNRKVLEHKQNPGSGIYTRSVSDW